MLARHLARRMLNALGAARKRFPGCRVFKRSSDPWVGREAAKLAWSGAIDRRPPSHRAIEELEGSVYGSLEGQVRETSFQHEVVHADAAMVARRVSSPPQAKVLLWELIHIVRPRWVVELGSAFGVAAMYMADALARDGTGSLDGIEFEAWRAAIANRSLQAHWPGIARVHAGRIEEVLPRLLAQPPAPLDFAFVDAVHKFSDCMGYHRLLSEAVTNGATVVWDDVDFSEDMMRFWKALVAQPNVTDAILLRGRWGLVRYSADIG